MNCVKSREGTQSQTSESTLNDISLCILELIDNSIAAESTCIAVKLNFAVFQIHVVDNGSGISKHKLQTIESRFDDGKPSRRRSTLAEIKDICSRLMIVTRPVADKTTFCKVFDDSHCTDVVEALHHRAVQGTTVTIYNILKNFPIRQKQIVSSVEIQYVKQHVQAVAIMHPSINFIVKDDEKSIEIVRIERSNSSLRTFSTLFSNVIRQPSSIVRVKAEIGDIEMRAMIREKPRKCGSPLPQFIYVNKRYVIETEIRNRLRELLWNGFLSKNSSKTIHIGLKPRHNVTSSKNGKNVAFVLNVYCPTDEFEIGAELNKRRRVEFRDGTKIDMCLKNLVEAFFKHVAPGDDKERAEQGENDRRDQGGDAKPSEGAECRTKRAFDKLYQARVVQGVPADRDTCFRNAKENSSDRIFEREIIDEKNKQNATNCIDGDDENVHVQTVEDKRKLLSSKSFTPDTPLFARLSEVPVLKTHDAKNHPSQKKKLKEWANNLAIGKPSESLGSRRRTCHVRSNVKTNSNIRFYDVKKTYHLQRNQRCNKLKRSIGLRRFKNPTKSRKVAEMRGKSATRERKRKLESSKQAARYEAFNFNPKLTFSSNISKFDGTKFLASMHTSEEESRKQKQPVVLSTEDFICVRKIGEENCKQEKNKAGSQSFGSDSVANYSKLFDSVGAKMARLSIVSDEIAEKAIESPYFRNNAESSNDEGKCCCKCHRAAASQVSREVQVCEKELGWRFDQNEVLLTNSNENRLSDDDESELNIEYANLFGDGKNKSSTRSECVSERNSISDDVISNVCASNLNATVDGNFEANSRKMLVEKMRYKMKSKFLEFAPVIDIPNGMLAVEKDNPRLYTLPDDERKYLKELVKPCNMRNHITIDDFGNSCLRIFPYLEYDGRALTENQRVNALKEENCSVEFSKYDLKSLKFLAQIDRKFLVAILTTFETTNRILVVLDQHAVDERIRVERLTKEYVDENGRWRSTSINPPVHLIVSRSDVSVIADFMAVFVDKGFGFDLNYTTAQRRNEHTVYVVKVPSCLYQKAHREMTKNAFNLCLKQSVRSSILDLIDTLMKTRGMAHGIVPNAMQNVVNSEACRGAVKFGDNLSLAVCVSLLKNLSFCDVPFYCAHGRPLMAPLLNLCKLKHLEKEMPESCFQKLKNLGEECHPSE